MAKNLLKLDEQLCFALYRTSRAIIRSYTPMLEPLNLTYPQYLVMLVLWEHDQLSVNEIGARLMLDSATLTPLLKKLEEKEYLTRQRQAHDERVVQINLTSVGKNLRKKATEVPQKLACALGANLEDEQQLKNIQGLRETLNNLANQMNR